MRIAVIGTGNIGSTLGRAWSTAGHDVVLGSRHPDGAHDSRLPVTDIGSALADAEAVLLAIPAAAVESFLSEHAAALRGPLVIDATNRIGAPVANAHATLAGAVSGLRYVRAFNTLGWENFADPLFDGVPADLFFSATEADRSVAEELISAVGLRPAYLGPDAQDVVDHALPLWLGLMRQRGTRQVALRVLER
jgi:predicted dinucleotide-binding enzyme